MNQLDAIISIASDLTAGLSSEERYRRLLAAIRNVVPYDAAALLRLEDTSLVPIVAEGLSPDALGRRFALDEQPRLRLLCEATEPVIFPVDSELSDPYDGLLASDLGDFQRIHACLGCPLRVRGELLGVLTADAAQPHAFDHIDRSFLAAVGALAAAELRTTQLIEALERSADRQGRIARDLMRDVELRQGSDMIGTSAVMQRLRQDIELVARSDLTVLITGETGVGKELVARAVHNASMRHAEPMLYVNCAALPETLADSELFGHVKGSFTGASSDRMGKFEVANGGTLFLDEIGELPLSVQPKLLRAIQQGEIQRVGSDKAIKADVRILAATNRDLEREVQANRFRADLYHRLNVYPLSVPALRERAEDIPLLAGYFCDLMRRRLGLGPVRLEPEAVVALQRYPWPGNVRELENVLSRVTLNAASGVSRTDPVVIRGFHLGPDFAASRVTTETDLEAGVTKASASMTLHQATRDFQRTLIARTLQEHHGNWSATARHLGMHRSNLHHLAIRLGMKST
ncbi:MAG TPA: nitric oxide reductase transcriptional regulator NorR [Polyangiaceae bacterium]|jgi:anaerobic nitric oxide reductase transcription regulator|nr:MAG: Regulatory protein LuxO [Deltaproteobacteria bacterium ADurb.Bin207]HNS96313.1 nitric oxide reductase transcriptional regulator NorR [Polyangiaceae bacterium]HNZ22045.1 nitric oxide reductase transcriptional regulator NorR [Polyangiaceae bacterium]HOD22199.1 nitric oxide reductase transcriptional regulator NorR [Polyangiaceae bacterium]HOE47353.1 nitric oxide reductase transcriptional regulator NorR [Polyangiaceae bacterium]